MNLPTIGEKVFAFQHKNDRIGETMFLLSTNEHVTTNYATGLAEALEEVCGTGNQVQVGDELFEELDTSLANNLIVWEMKRIR